MGLNGDFLSAKSYAQASASALTDLREAYSNEGYVLAKQIFSETNLGAMRQALRSILDKSITDDAERNGSLEQQVLRCEARDHSIVYKAAQSVGSSAATYQLIGSSGILDAISAVTGFQKTDLHLMPMYLIIQLPSDERFDYAWHQDGAYYPWCQDFLTLWFPVNRSTKRDTGTISVIPGSHRYGQREADTYFRDGYFRQIQSKLQDDEGSREEALEVELGDCCIMHGNTVHRSVANRGTSPRIAGVLRMANLSTQKAYERERFYCTHKS
jgi:ectoine hydroxylase-related dioxygenase (phytanoyl-CoA dioxygenase family)